MDSPVSRSPDPQDKGGNLAEAFLRLPAAGRREVHRRLCAAALEVWRRYAAEEKEIRYVDSVVGLAHTVDPDLPADAFHAAFCAAQADESAAAAVEKRYLEPMVALHDEDVAFPGNVEYAYYAIHNAFLKYARGAEMDDWVIANQALSADPDEASWRPAMIAALRAAEALAKDEPAG